MVLTVGAGQVLSCDGPQAGGERSFLRKRATAGDRVVMNIMFLVGVALGIPLAAAALWRSRAVPRTAAALLVAFLAVDLTGQGTSIGAIAHILALIAASWIAVTVIRTPPLQP
jgi:hypothetical protein